MGQRNFDEFFAKVVLEECFSEKFSDLQISDKPDLRFGDKIGIEVTNCMPKDAVEEFVLWRKKKIEGAQTPPRMKRPKVVHLIDKRLVWNQGIYKDDIDNSPIKDFIDAIKKKLDRLKNYEEMQSYELFVNSALDVSDFKQINAILDRLICLNENRTKKFEKIYLTTINQTLLIFDVGNRTFQILHLYAHLERMAKLARDMYKRDIAQNT